MEEPSRQQCVPLCRRRLPEVLRDWFAWKLYPAEQLGGYRQQSFIDCIALSRHGLFTKNIHAGRITCYGFTEDTMTGIDIDLDGSKCTQQRNDAGGHFRHSCPYWTLRQKQIQKQLTCIYEGEPQGWPMEEPITTGGKPWRYLVGDFIKGGSSLYHNTGAVSFIIRFAECSYQRATLWQHPLFLLLRLP